MFGVEARLAILATTRHPPELPNEEELMLSLRQKLGPHADEALLLQHLRESRGKLHWAVNSYFRAVLGSPVRRGCREDFQSKPRAQPQCVRRTLLSAGAASKFRDTSSGTAANSTTSSGSSSGEDSSNSNIADTQAVAHTRTALTDHRCSVASLAGPNDGPIAVFETDNHCSTCDTTHGPAAAGMTPDANALSAAVDVPRLDGLPAPLVEEVFKHLDVASLCSAASTCASLRKASQSEALWERLFLQRWGDVVFPLNGPPAPTARAQQHFVPLVWEGNAAMGRMAQLPPHHQQPQQQSVQSELVHPRHEQQQQAPEHWHARPQLHSQQTASSSSQVQASARKTPSHCAQAHASSTSQASAAPSPAGPPHNGVSMGPPPPSIRNRRSGWRGLYRRQHGYQTALRCPRCGVGRVLPLVYGFPSDALIAGMPVRLMLGGDHLIEQAYVWACPACRACYKTYPFENVQLWLQDDAERLQRQQYGSNNRGAVLAAGAGLPQYTYEL